jgi:hypothetical protein
MDILMAENQILKKTNRADKAVSKALLDMGNSRSSIICTNTNGIITYVSPGAERLLGYTAAELVGVNSLLKIHYPGEIMQRARELENETGKRVVPGLGVLVEKTMRSRGKEDVRMWTYVKKDNSLVPVQVAIRPLFDEKSIFGFAEVATELDAQPPTPKADVKIETPAAPSSETATQQDRSPSTFLTSPVPTPGPALSASQSTSTPQAPIQPTTQEEEALLNALFDGENLDNLESLDLLDIKWAEQ